MAVETPELEIRISTYDYLERLLKENGWNKKAWLTPDVAKQFKERTLTKTQLTKLVTILNESQSVFEEKTKLSGILRGDLVESIGLTYTFGSLKDLCDALDQRGVKYPEEYLGQAGSSFKINFNAPRHLAKDRYEQLVKDLGGITGTGAEDDARRGEIIRAAFGETSSPQGAQTKSTEKATIAKNIGSAKEEIQKEVEKAELDVKSLESFIKLTNLILDRFQGSDRMTLQGIRGSFILDKIKASGYNYSFGPRGITLSNTDGKNTTEAMEKSVAFETLIKTNTISIDELKYGLLYTTPSFEVYANNSRLNDGTPNKKATPQTYIEFLRKKPAKELTIEEKIVLSSGSALSNIKMPELIQSFQNLGQINGTIANNPALAATVQGVTAAAQGTNTPVSTEPATPPGTIQSGANNVAGKAGEFAGEVGENIGKFASGTMQAIGKGFEKGGAIGGLAVAVIGIFGAWKFLTGEWGTKNHKMSGWMIALLGFGGKAAYDMAIKYGLIESATDAAKGVAQKFPKLAPTEQKPAAEQSPKKVEKDAENGLTPSEQLASEAAEKNEDLRSMLASKTPALTEYVNFINKDLKGISLAKLITKENTSIFHPSGVLHADIQGKIGNLNPISLKKVLRAYLGADVKFATAGISDPGKKERETFEKKLAEKGLNVEAYTTERTLTELISAIYAPVDKPQEPPRLSAEAKKKILEYSIVAKDKPLTTDNFEVIFHEIPDNEGDFKVTLNVKDAKKINKKADKIEPIEIYFDKDGNLRSSQIGITGCAIILGVEVGKETQTCTLKQDKNTIVITKA